MERLYIREVARRKDELQDEGSSTDTKMVAEGG